MYQLKLQLEKEEAKIIQENRQKKIDYVRNKVFKNQIQRSKSTLDVRTRNQNIKKALTTDQIESSTIDKSVLKMGSEKYNIDLHIDQLGKQKAQ